MGKGRPARRGPRGAQHREAVPAESGLRHFRNRKEDHKKLSNQNRMNSNVLDRTPYILIQNVGSWKGDEPFGSISEDDGVPILLLLV